MMIDPVLVERLHVTVGERLSEQARAAERGGEVELSEPDRRQFALSLIRAALATFAPRPFAARS